jgi:hypothetical protein
MLKKVDLTLDSHHDFALLASTLALVSLGLTMVFISSTVMANSQYQDPYFFVKRQTFYALLGVGVLVLGRSTDYHRYKDWVYWFLFAALIGLVLVFLPGLGTKVRGAARWVRLGPLTLQPSEFAKLAMVIFLAYSLSRKQEKMKYFAIGFLPHMVIAGVFIALIGKEPDFGTALTLAGIVFIMLLVGGTRLTYILFSFSLAVPLAVVMVLRDPKKFSRILSFLDPWKYGRRGLSTEAVPSGHRLRGPLGHGAWPEPCQALLPPRRPHGLHPLHLQRRAGFYRDNSCPGPVHTSGFSRPTRGSQGSGRFRFLPGPGPDFAYQPARVHQYGRGEWYFAHQGTFSPLPELRRFFLAGQSPGGGHLAQYQQSNKAGPGSGQRPPGREVEGPGFFLKLMEG